MQINNTAIESERQQRASKVLEVYVRELIDSRKLNPSEYDGENSDILHQAWCNKRDLHKEREEFVEGMHCVGEILFYANSPI